MVHTCVVPGCSSRYEKGKKLTFHILPLSKNSLLKHWMYHFGRKNLPVNRHSRICSKHVIDSVGRTLRPDEVPTENLPKLPTKVSQSRVRRPLVRKALRRDQTEPEVHVPDLVNVGDDTMDVGTNAEIDVSDDKRTLETKLSTLTADIAMLKNTVTINRFRLECIADNDAKVAFYTGFPTYSHLKCFFDFLGSESAHLQYRDSKRVFDSSNKGRKRCLPPLEEFS